MMTLHDFNGKQAEVQNFSKITDFVRMLKKELYVPFLFINVHGFIIEDLNSHTIKQPEIENIINLMVEFNYIQNITFLSSKPETHRDLVKQQLISLFRCEGWSLRMTTDICNIPNAINNRILNSKEYSDCYRPWFVYIDGNFETSEKVLKLFCDFGIERSTTFVYSERSWNAFFASFILSERCKLYSFQNKRSKEI